MALVTLTESCDLPSSVQDKNGINPLILAVIAKKTHIVETLLQGGANPNIRNRRGETPLIRAAFWGYSAIVDILLGKGKADPNAAGSKGWTALHKAAFQGYVDVISTLLKYGADPALSIQTPDGDFTPFKIAQWYRQDQAIRFFKKFGINA